MYHGVSHPGRGCTNSSVEVPTPRLGFPFFREVAMGSIHVCFKVACGLDVHQAEVVACLSIQDARGRLRRVTRRFRTVYAELCQLRDWLVSEGCEALGMEATGHYWKPIYSVLEGHVRIIVGNPTQMKGLKGRKTDQQDAEWIADLTRLGLIKPSFVPPPDFRALREFLRTRRGMIQARTTLQNETLKALEIGGVKLSSFMSSVFGVSGMGMLRALARGESVAEQVHLLAKGKLRSKLTELRLALEQPLPIHLQQILAIQLERMDQLEGHLAALDARVEERMTPYEAERRLLMAISGLGRSSVNVILAEIGVDMGVFPTPAHLAAWAGLAPGSFETGGKHKRASTLKGNIYLKTILVECAGAAVRAKGTFFSAKFNQLRRRGLDYRKALVAIAHKLIVVIHRVLSGKTPFQDLGAAHFEQRNRARTIRNLTRRLETLGFAVSLQNLSIESESLQ